VKGWVWDPSNHLFILLNFFSWRIKPLIKIDIICFTFYFLGFMGAAGAMRLDKTLLAPAVDDQFQKIFDL
jgi:hypothetical protein